VIFIQKCLKDFLKRSKHIKYYERLVIFWDKSEKNLITIFINRCDKYHNIMNINNLSLKLKAYTVETKTLFEKIITNEPFLYKLQRHKRINLKSLKEFFIVLKGMYFLMFQ